MSVIFRSINCWIETKMALFDMCFHIVWILAIMLFVFVNIQVLCFIKVYLAIIALKNCSLKMSFLMLKQVALLIKTYFTIITFKRLEVCMRNAVLFHICFSSTLLFAHFTFKYMCAMISLSMVIKLMSFHNINIAYFAPCLWYINFWGTLIFGFEYSIQYVHCNIFLLSYGTYWFTLLIYFNLTIPIFK